MSKISPNNYINIQGWMVTELNLKGNELLVYAIIYGMSQDDNSLFSGSRQYLADWCNCSVRSIQTILNALTESGLLTKYEEMNNGVKYCSYVANFTGGENFSRGSEEISLNNQVNNKSKKVVSKDTTSESEPEFEFGKPKTSKPNLYQQCLALIDEKYGSMTNIRKLLIEYLNLRLDIASQEGKTLYVNQWKGILNSLGEVHKQGFALEAIIKQSISKGYKSFYPVNTQTSKQCSYDLGEQKKVDVSNLSGVSF